MKRIFRLLGILIVLMFVAAPAFAHKVNLFAYYEDGTVFTESYFPDGTKVKGGAVEVYDAKGDKVVSGKTDKEGIFSFPWTKKEDLTIKINATMGHKNEFILTKDDME